MTEQQPTAAQINEWKEKADKWDALSDQVGGYYSDAVEDDSEHEGKLLDIGETAARAFGYM
jgi:hypothetical protein